jgi:magnesium transporter
LAQASIHEVPAKRKQAGVADLGNARRAANGVPAAGTSGRRVMPEGAAMPKKHGDTPSFMVDAKDAHVTVDRDAIAEHLEAGEFFWLDLHKPTTDDIAMLGEVFKFHPLALEDARHFGQRPKYDPFDQFAYLVVYGVNEDKDGLVEVHCFYSGDYLVTVHRDICPTFDELRRRAAADLQPPAQGAMLLYQVVDSLVDSFLPGLAKLDDRIDELENGVVQQPDDEQLQELFRLKRRLVTWRKVVTPERDTFARIVTGVIKIPGMTPDMERYFRDVYDHLIRISDLIDSYRDLLTGAMDVYLSTVSNRLNEIMKRLTIVATIFMPLTFIVGFFGMNFTWMVTHITGFWPFFWLAIVSEVVAVVVMWLFFRREKWI